MTYCSGTFCCSTRMSASDSKVDGTSQLPTHTIAQAVKRGSRMYQRRRRAIAQYSSRLRDICPSSSSSIATPEHSSDRRYGDTKTPAVPEEWHYPCTGHSINQNYFW